MTSDQLLKFLGNRNYLHQISYEELKTMVLQYPYSLSLRYLLTMKSQQEDHKEHDRNIELLATYGIDRSHFFKIFRDKTIELEDLQESVLLSEDYLELKELSALEREMDKKLVNPNQNDIIFEENVEEDAGNYVKDQIDGKNILQTRDSTLPEKTTDTAEVSPDGLPKDAVEVNDFFLPSEAGINEEDRTAEEAVSDHSSFVNNPGELLEEESKSTPIGSANESFPFEKNKERIPLEIISTDSADWSPTEEMEKGLDNTKTSPTYEKRLNPTPKSFFKSWKEQDKGISTLSGIYLLPLSEETLPFRKETETEKTTSRFKETIAFAEESLKISNDITSETLAQLLVEQGHYERARSMYKKLCLIMPEKSAFFAAKIEEIKHLEDQDENII